MKSLLRAFAMCCAVTFACVQAGCVRESESLYEVDHVVPSHWPADLRDAAEKLKSRLDAITAAPQSPPAEAALELKELVEWSPEIAADTDMNEADWLTIYTQSEAIREQLARPRVDYAALRPQIDMLAARLLEMHQQLVVAEQEQAEKYE